MTIEEILAKPAEQWTDADLNVILAEKKEKGHEYVKRLRDRIQAKLTAEAENTSSIDQPKQEETPIDNGLSEPQL